MCNQRSCMILLNRLVFNMGYNYIREHILKLIKERIFPNENVEILWCNKGFICWNKIKMDINAKNNWIFKYIQLIFTFKFYSFASSSSPLYCFNYISRSIWCAPQHFHPSLQLMPKFLPAVTACIMKLYFKNLQCLCPGVSLCFKNHSSRKHRPSHCQLLLSSWPHAYTQGHMLQASGHANLTSKAFFSVESHSRMLASHSSSIIQIVTEILPISGSFFQVYQAMCKIPLA